MRPLVIAATLLSLSACTEIEQAADNTGRQVAKGAVAEALATRFPQVPKELLTPFTDCVIDNAAALEVREFARAAVVGVDDAMIGTIRNILARPETQQCLSQRAAAKGIF
ncbi:hypothetical protein ACFSUD_12270 [Sulfitobacter aestuarii]|uniref:Succinate dehydrogenase n=1 Tax=Sulfitobacter aestuarii TaxID=2161676 RepID=A0ABW5U3F0_9RHOB